VRQTVRSTNWLAAVLAFAVALALGSACCDEDVELGLSPGVDASADTHPDHADTGR
jgi:hypothetical protein